MSNNINQCQVLTCAVIIRGVCLAPAATSIGHFEQSSLGLHAVRAVLPKLVKLVSSSPVLACCQVELLQCLFVYIGLREADLRKYISF